MRQFEYRVEMLVSVTRKELNEFGQDGWELVSLENIRSGQAFSLIFKREITLTPSTKQLSTKQKMLRMANYLEVTPEVFTAKYPTDAEVEALWGKIEKFRIDMHKAIRSSGR